MTAVMHCYAVKNIWEPGAIYTSAEYSKFAAAVKAVKGVQYHTAAKPSSSTGITWTQFAENDVTALGEGASFKVLHADPTPYPSDINRNSTVLRVTLGTHSVLFAGDAEAGARAVPMSKAGDVEALLLANHASELAVDVLQVGHHGSETSSRSAFVDAVFPAPVTAQGTPRYALLSAGPRAYSGVVLPDAAIVSEYDSLASQGVTLLETNVHDAAGCPTKDRVGLDDSSPAGCDNYVLTFR
jgi:competence protein ComEC